TRLRHHKALIRRSIQLDQVYRNRPFQFIIFIPTIDETPMKTLLEEFNLFSSANDCEKWETTLKQ
ncbi:hypothetical protein PFISCL1PPCAC_2196, partial [Pristionchus fissidentatus]